MKMREVCRRTGLTERTVRFYVEQGLLNPVRDRMNGRTYLTFSEEDIQLLEDLATLRRAQFSISEIAALQQDFAVLTELLHGKAEVLRSEAEEAEAYAAALEQLQPEALTGLQSLAQALRHPSGKYESIPRFGRFDPESPRERDAAYAAFLQHRAQQEQRRRVLLAGIAALLLVFLSIFGTLAVTGTLPHSRTEPFIDPVSTLNQYYTEAQLPTLDGVFRAWLAPSEQYALQEAGLDAITGHLILNYVNHQNSSCVLTVECEPLDEMACALVDDQSLPLMTLLTHPETPEARVELIVPGGTDTRYYAIYLHSRTLTEGEIINQFGTLYIRMPWGTGYQVEHEQITPLETALPAYSSAQSIDTLPVSNAAQQLQVFRWGYWRDTHSDSQIDGLYRLVTPDGSADYYLLGQSVDWPDAE